MRTTAAPPSSDFIAAENKAVGRFYDRVCRLYPVFDLCCGAGRSRLIGHINGVPPGRLPDVGVGPGRHLRHYRRHAISAIDCSAAMVALSRRAGGADVRLMDGERLEFADASFDYLVLSHVLAVTSNPARMLAESHRVLRPGGLAFVLNHETPEGAWRHVEAAAAPFGRWLRVRTWFRLREIEGVERFSQVRSVPGGWLGWVAAYALEK